MPVRRCGRVRYTVSCTGTILGVPSPGFRGLCAACARGDAVERCLWNGFPIVAVGAGAAHAAGGVIEGDVGDVLPRGGPVAATHVPSLVLLGNSTLLSPGGGAIYGMRQFAVSLAPHGSSRRTKSPPLVVSPQRVGAACSRDDIDLLDTHCRYGGGPDNDRAMDDQSDQPRLVKRGSGSTLKQFTAHTLRRLASGIRLVAAPSKDSSGSDDNDNDNECVPPPLPTSYRPALAPKRFGTRSLPIRWISDASEDMLLGRAMRPAEKVTEHLGAGMYRSQPISVDSETDSQSFSRSSGTSGTSSSYRLKESSERNNSWSSNTESENNNHKSASSEDYYQAFTHFLGGVQRGQSTEGQQQQGLQPQEHRRMTYTGVKMHPQSTAQQEEDDDWPVYEVARTSSRGFEGRGHASAHDEPGASPQSSRSKCQNPMMTMTHPLTLEESKQDDYWVTPTPRLSLHSCASRISMDSLRQVPECVPWPLLSLTLAVSFRLGLSPWG